jgi:hypothetical protein
VREDARVTGGWSEGRVGVPGCEFIGEAARAFRGGEDDIVYKNKNKFLEQYYFTWDTLLF